MRALVLSAAIAALPSAVGNATFEAARPTACRVTSGGDVGVFEIDEPERSGCCSHHGGVCGCSAGRAQCCDGSLSPSCGC